MTCREKFLKILRIEVDDLESHLERLIEEHAEREHRHEVSERVCLANVAVFRNEECALEHFRRIIDNVNPADHEDLDELVAWLQTRFKDELKRSGLSPAASFFTSRKMQRVEQYVRHGNVA
jgi:hypothetical protein